MDGMKSSMSAQEQITKEQTNNIVSWFKEELEILRNELKMRDELTAALEMKNKSL